MILVDFNQIAYSTILDHMATSKQTEASADLVRHMMLNTLRANVKRFKQQYGEVVVIYDSATYWRKEIFPHYKANRKKHRDKSPFNWASIFNCMNQLRDEFQENLLYKVVCVPGAEADDVIGVLTTLFDATQKVLIVSGDKDFVQLQTHKNVCQYSPLLKKMITDPYPLMTLKQHIIRGDSGDGIPNILSADDVFVSGGRQKPIQEKKIIDWLNKPVEEFCVSGDMLRNYRRNEQLIDLRMIPSDLCHKIGHAYEGTSPRTRTQFFNYLVSTGCKEMLKCIDDF